MLHKLGNVASIVTGGTPSTSNNEYWSNGTIPWLQSGCCQNCYVNKATKYITKLGYDNSVTKMMPAHTILIALTGATAGKVGYLTFEACGNQSITGITPKNDLLLPKYLYYFLMARREKTVSDCTGGAQPHISQAYVKNILINLPSIENQTKTINCIDDLNRLIDKGLNEIKCLYELIKSRFNEMFLGNKFNLVSMKELSIKKAEYGASSASIEYDSIRPRYVRITDINDDGTLNDDVVCSINKQDDITYKLSYGDFLFARMGNTVGKTYAYYSGEEIFAGYLIRYKLNLDLINPKYLFYFTKTNEYHLWVNNNKSGAAQPGINAKKYDELQIPLPSIELQNEFVAFANQIDKLKFIK